VAHSRRAVGYLLVAVLAVAACLLYSFQRQRAEAVQVADRTESAVTALTASFGVATIPHHAGGAELLLRRADRACYLAKDRGRNRVQVAATDDQPDYSMPRSPDTRPTGRAASTTAAATAVGTEGSNTDGTM
jgi:hypothetical protein